MAGQDRMDDASARRHALSLASQLPDNQEDAQAVIDHMQSIHEMFLSPRPVKHERVGTVLYLK